MQSQRQLRLLLLRHGDHLYKCYIATAGCCCCLLHDTIITIGAGVGCDWSWWPHVESQSTINWPQAVNQPTVNVHVTPPSPSAGVHHASAWRSAVQPSKRRRRRTRRRAGRRPGDVSAAAAGVDGGVGPVAASPLSPSLRWAPSWDQRHRRWPGRRGGPQRGWRKHRGLSRHITAGRSTSTSVLRYF